MIRVIGLGSPFGDDRAGWRVIELLHGRVPPGVELIALDRPGAGLVAWLEGVERLVLIDALAGGPPRGAVLRLNPAATAQGAAAFSTHGLDLAGTLRLAETLALRPPQIALYGIAVGAADTAQMHDEVETAAQRLADRLAVALQAPKEGD